MNPGLLLSGFLFTSRRCDVRIDAYSFSGGGDSGIGRRLNIAGSCCVDANIAAEK